MYKAIRPDGTSHYDEKTIWKIGEPVVAPYIDPSSKVCSPGIHCSEKLLDAVSYQFGPSQYLEVEPGEIVASDATKMRCRSVLPIRFLDKEEIDSLAGFKLWEANHPVNPLLLEPDQTLDTEKLLEEWSIVRASMGGNVWSSVSNSVRNSVCEIVKGNVWRNVFSSVRGSMTVSVFNSVEGSMTDSVWDSMWDSVRGYIGGLFSEIEKWEGVEGSDPWRPLLTLWYGGYVPYFDNSWKLLSKLEKS